MNRAEMQFPRGSGSSVKRWSSRIVTQLVVLTIALPIAACSPSGQVKTYPVKGFITFEGKPMVGGGAISLIPTTNQSGKAAGGTIKPDGTYILGTYTESDGSMAGDFKVVIFQETAKEGQSAPDGSAPSATASTSVAAADRIPVLYANDRQTPLTAKIEAKPNEINFDLKRQQ
jgi:hypothetical protein